MQPRAGLFDFLNRSTKKDSRSEALVEELIARSKSAGNSASRKQEIVELVSIGRCCPISWSKGCTQRVIMHPHSRFNGLLQCRRMI